MTLKEILRGISSDRTRKMEFRHSIHGYDRVESVISQSHLDHFKGLLCRFPEN